MSFNKILVSLASTALLASATTGFSAMLTSNNQAIDYGTLSVMDAGNAGDISITTGSGISVQAAAVSPGMVYENVEAVEGSSYSVVALEDLALGEYQLTLTDFEFFDPFERLGAALTTASQSVAELILTDMAQDSITFNIGNQDSYYLSIFAQGATQCTPH